MARIAAVGLAVVALGAGASPAAGKLFTVNTTADKTDQSTADGDCKASDGTCSLRAALQQANALVGADEVTVPAGTYTVTLGTLPITSSLAITAPAGARATTLDAGGTMSYLNITGSGIVSVTGLALTKVAAYPIHINGPEVTLTGLWIHDNTHSSGRGGGISMEGGTLALLRSSITDNKVTSGSQAVGGGLYVGGGNALVVATTIARNTAEAVGVGTSSYGGGIGNLAGLTLRHVTLLDNTVLAGSAARSGGNLYSSTDVPVADSILVGGVALSGNDCSGTVTATGKNIYGAGAGNCAFAAGTVVGADPGLNALGDHGGPGLTAVPQPGSAALNAAAACPDGATDQRGAPAPSGSACDIGAAEASADLQVELQATADSVAPGEQVTYLAKVTNAGVDDSPSTVLTVTPAGAETVLVSSSTGSCTAAAVCSLGTVASGQSASVTVVVRAPASGSIETAAGATGGVPDPTPANASASRTTTVSSSPPTPPAADTTPPVITGLGAKAKLVAGKAGVLRATLSEAATVTVDVLRLRKARRLKGRCRTSNRRGPRCTVARKVGSVTAPLAAGPGVLTLPAKLGGRALPAGRYRLRATAVDAAGNTSAKVTASVTVRRRTARA